MTDFNFANVVFNTPRSEGEVNLVDLVRGNLIEHYSEDVVAACFDSHPLVAGCKDANSTVQKTNLTRFWTQQLVGVQNSQSARLHLVPGAEVTLWYKNFSEGVLPFCLDAGAFKKVHS